MNKVIILHTIEHYKNYNLIYNKIKSNNLTQFIAINIELRLFLRRKKIPFKIPEQFISANQAEEMDDIALSFGYNWHNNLFSYKDINLGQLNDWNMIYYFMRIIRNFQLILNIIEKEKTLELISFKCNDYYINEFNNILQYICSLKKISLILTPIEKKYKIIREDSKIKILRRINSIPTLKPIKLGTKYFSDFIRKLFYNRKKEKNIKTVLMYGSSYYKSLTREVSKKNNVLLINEKLTTYEIINNLRNLILRKNLGFNIFLEHFKTKKLKKKTEYFLENLINKWKNVIREPNFKNSFRYKEISLWPIIKNNIINVINDFKRIVENILVIYKLLLIEKIDIIALSTDISELGKTIAIIANKLNIPSIVFQHGITGGKLGFLPLNANKIAIWGNISKNFLHNHGLSVKKMEITGAPRFDIYKTLVHNKELSEKIKKKVHSDFGIDKNKKLIVLASSNQDFNISTTSTHLNREEVMKIFETALNAIKNLPNSHLIIKLHYNDINGFISKQMKQDLEVQNVSIVKRYNLENLLVSCDCLLTSWSTTGLEALFLGKPLICIKFWKKPYPVPFIEYNAAFEVKNAEELINKLNLIYQNPKIYENERLNFLNDYIHKLDGSSTKRAYNLILKMLTKV